MAWENEPKKMEFKKGGKVFFCACGLSEKGALCDGAHKGTGKKPEVKTFEKDVSIFVCRCGQSDKFPFCDGAHQSLK